jgi:formyltetrahydrofolate deformylase
MPATLPPAGQKTARLLIVCPDARGIIAAVVAFMAQRDGNILDADQHTESRTR